MYRKLKYCIVQSQWRMLLLTEREIHLIGIIAAAVITTLVTGALLKSFYSTAVFPSRFVRRHDCEIWKTTPGHKTTLITKTACLRNCFLLILVSTAPANLERRNLIRQTWGAYSNTAAQWKTYFLIAQTRNQTLSDLVKTEENNYGDIIRGDYYEHYWNQSLKIQMAFEWAARYCEFFFLLKTDDDVLVNTEDLIKFLQRRSTPKQGLFMGKLHHHPKVRRAGKWIVSYEEYNQTYYPDFCSGAGFVVSHDVVECLVPLFDVIKPYRMDDVYVGMLAKEVGVIPVNNRDFFMPFDGYDDCIFKPNTLVQHRATGQCLLKLLRMHDCVQSNGLFYYRNIGSYF